MFPPPVAPTGLAEVAAQLRAVGSQISQLQAAQVALVAQIEALGPLIDTTVPAWVMWQAGLTPQEAHRNVRLARRLTSLPQLAAAFEQGRLSEGTVDLLSSVATAENETAILDLTKTATGAQLKKIVATFKRVRPNGDRDDKEVTESVSYHSDETGTWRLNARLRKENGARFEAALEAMRGAGYDPGADDNDATRLSNPEALLAMADVAVGTTTKADGLLPERYLTLVHLDGNTLDASLHSGGAIEHHTICELLCESWISLVIKRGEDVTVTSPSRLATPAQRRALLVRDRHCRYPGCDRTRNLRAHHIVFAEHGGPTSLDNLILLCAHHHNRIHCKGWRLRRSPDGEITITNPYGVHITPIERPPNKGHPPPGPGPRHHGTGDHLTNWALDLALHHWLTAS